MKKTTIILSMLLMVIAVVIPGISVCAGEVTTYTDIEVTATVPDGFDEDIIVSLKSNIVRGGGVVLTAENGYVSSTNLLGGNTYTTAVRYSNNGNWKCDIEEQYEIPNGVDVEIFITVTDGSIENNILTEEQPQSVHQNTEVPHSEEIDPLTNLLKGELVVKNFIEKTSFIQNDETYQSWNFLGIYSGEGLIKDYLDSNPNNTEEQWNGMTEYEKYVWNAVYFMPSLYMFKSDNVDEFIENVTAIEKSLFKNNEYTNEEVVYDALVELCKWHYSYFQVTGTVYDYYNGVEYVLDEETQEVVEVEKPKEEMVDKELQELQEEVMAELTDEEKEELGISTQNTTSPILPITIIALCIIIAILIFILIQKRKK